MQKRIYHESAIMYNTELAEFAEKLSEEIEDEVVQRWCKSVAKQHRFHAKRHETSLANLDRIQQQSSDEDILPGPSDLPVVELTSEDDEELLSPVPPTEDISQTSLSFSNPAPDPVEEADVETVVVSSEMSPAEKAQALREDQEKQNG